MKRFLHQEFRQDVRNISAMLYIARGSEQWPDENADESAKGPVGQRAGVVSLVDYLAEHDYLQQVEFPVIEACLQPDDVKRRSRKFARCWPARRSCRRRGEFGAVVLAAFARVSGVVEEAAARHARVWATPQALRSRAPPQSGSGRACSGEGIGRTF